MECLAVYLLALSICTISLVQCDTCSPSKNLLEGSIETFDKLLLERSVSGSSMVVGRTIIFEGPGVNISYIMAVQVGGVQDATVEILKGGLQQDNVTLSFVSVPGGFSYNVVIWGTQPRELNKYNTFQEMIH